MKSFLFLAALAASITVFAKESKTILYLNGKVQYEYEVEGHVFQGRFSSYYESGKLRMKGQFFNNQKTGLWRVWDEKGLLRSERKYADNLNFTPLNQWDSTGLRIRGIKEEQSFHNRCGFTDRLFSHRYISNIDADHPDNKELFDKGGFVSTLMESIMNGSATAFAEDRFRYIFNKLNLSCYDQKDVVAILVKEEYYCCAKDQNMKNTLLGVCPIVMEDGRRKELGWFYVPQIGGQQEASKKLMDHTYVSTIIRSTVNDMGYRFKDVDIQQNDLLRLMLVEFEANAILYTIDREYFATR